MSKKQEIIDEILLFLQDYPEIADKKSFHKAKNTILAKFKEKDGPTGIEMIARYQHFIKTGKMEDDIRIHKILRKRAVRSLSGVAVISLLTKFWGCPGKCVFCPTYEGLPKSYITDEPAVQRAEANQFDAVKQVQNRLRALEITGNSIVKCDVRVIGGTWSVYPREYQEDFIRNIYDAHTTFSDLRPFIEGTFGDDELDDVQEKEEKIKKQFAKFQLKKGYQMKASLTLEEAKKRNETADSRVIGVAIETRPDWINEEEIIRLRRYGVTRVEIGYQTTDDKINLLNQRGHGNLESIRATRLLKDAGFKVVAHMMPGLVGAYPEGDIESMKRVFDDSDFRPDE
ncbi:radical SAM protein, partial [Candidatus Gracilibacteria bacterium]|nr:radical SAM protein [Candidatus Gracilibacteria bacterium]